MKVAILVTALFVAQQPDIFPNGDHDLVKEIKGWKKGDPPPGKLLQFPDGPPAFPKCGFAMVDVERYISGINDEELLKALLFDWKADSACVKATATRLIELRGFRELRTIVAQRRKTNLANFGTELATLTQLLASPYLCVQVASLEKKDVPKGAAAKALTGLKGDLTAGVPWDRAYMKAADSLFDKERSQKEEGGWRTFLCYRYRGLISPTGFDLLSRQISEFHPDHIRRLFEAKRGVLQFETADEYWLYYIEEFYD